MIKTAAIKTASDLKSHVESAGHDPHFFTRETMRFFGDTMRNYGVRGPVSVETYSGTVQAYELFRRRSVKHGLASSAFFDAATFARVFPATASQKCRDGVIDAIAALDTLE